MRNFGSRLAQLTTVAGAIGIAVACSQPGTPLAPSSTANASAVVRTAELFSFELCKDYVGTPGPAAVFTIGSDVGANGSIDSTQQVSLSDGQCQEFNIAAGDPPVRFHVTELVPTGYVASFVRTIFEEPITQPGGVTTVEPSVTGNTAIGFAGGDRGILIVFTNTELPPPPPPPGDGQGCTPGYWKQSQHFDSWTAPFTPTTLFSDVFENAFPGMTLQQVLSQGGGGLKALGRHTVAALLNAASSGVSYPLTTQQVIDGFNGVFPGGDFETLHLRWAALNEAGCPLN
jgi:hypothetical protein